MVELLLAFGADPQIKVQGKDAVALAVQNNQIRVLKIIQEKGKIALSENYRSENGYTKAALANNFDKF